VPYKGGAGPALSGLVARETHLMVVTASSAGSNVKERRRKAPGGGTAHIRVEQFRGAATTGEESYPEMKASSWQGIFPPVGTPKDVVERLHEIALQTMASPEVGQRLSNGGVIVATSENPAAFAQFVANETQRWAKVVKEAGATPD